MDRFNSLVQETYQLSEDEYLQKTKNTQDQTYSLIYRENGRYSEPVELTHGVENPEDIEQLVIGAQENGVTELLEPREHTEVE
jgi:hypothetical protein